jgi:hypothetical protein
MGSKCTGPTAICWINFYGMAATTALTPMAAPLKIGLGLLLEVTQAAVDVWGRDRVGVRLSPSSTFNGMGDADPRATFGYAVRALNAFNLAYLHLLEPSEADLRYGGTPHPHSRVSPPLPRAPDGELGL